MNPRDLTTLLRDLAEVHASVVGRNTVADIAEGRMTTAATQARRDGRALLLADIAAKRTWTEACLLGQATRSAEDVLDAVGEEDGAETLAAEFLAAYRAH